MNHLPKLAFALAFLGFTSLSYAQDTAMSPDETITANVKSSIAQHSGLKADHLVVSTKDGTVYLRGMVDTQSEMKDVEEIAKHTSGVKKVVNETSVNSKGG